MTNRQATIRSHVNETEMGRKVLQKQFRSIRERMTLACSLNRWLIFPIVVVF